MTTLPDDLAAHLRSPELAPVWDAARGRLERTGLRVSGTLTVPLTAAGADRAGSLLGLVLRAGRVRIELADLDAALRASRAHAGLLDVLAALDGRAVRDRRAEKAADTSTWALLHSKLATAAATGLGEAPGWVDDWVEAVRRGGLLRRAGADQAAAAIGLLPTVFRALAPALAGQPVPGEVTLATLAATTTGDAHGLDSGRLPAVLVLRAAAVAFGHPAPASSNERRALWQRLGVATDQLSGTVLTYGLRPAGDGPWAAMMSQRADLHLVTHLTLHELAASFEVTWVRPGQRVWVCENPQILQGALAAALDAPIVCPSGNPATVGWVLLTQLLAGGADVAYHGDFDWPGMAIAARIIAAGARPWRLTAADYLAAAAAGGGSSLDGAAGPTPWDPALADAMECTGRAVHEEALVDVLLADVAARSGS